MREGGHAGEPRAVQSQPRPPLGRAGRGANPLTGGRPGFAGTIGGLLEARAAEGDRPFVTAAGTTSSYAEVAERAARLAAGLRKLGVARGDKVCLFLPNGFEFVLGMFAAARVGAVFVPAHPQLTGLELAYVLHQPGGLDVRAMTGRASGLARRGDRLRPLAV